MNYLSLFDYFTTRQPEMLDTIRQLVSFETPSHDKALLDAFATWLAARFQSAGAQVEIVPSEKAGNHLIARFGRVDRQKPALILCHFDTVWPVGTLARLPFRIENGCAYGPGIFDMQSSLALAEYALHAVRDLSIDLPRPVTILMTSDEEVGSRSSRALIEQEARKAEYVLVMESPLPGGMLKTARKGIGDYRLEVTGKAAHAGIDPEKGASAILELAYQIPKLYALMNREKGTTLNVGVVKGGTATNVIAADAVAQIDVRAWSAEESARITQAMATLEPMVAGCKLRVTGGWNRPPLERKSTMALYEKVRVIGARLGLDLKEGGTGGGSDGNFTGALGVPTIDGLGVSGSGAHADHEHIEVDQLASRAVLLVAILAEL